MLILAGFILVGGQILDASEVHMTSQVRRTAGRDLGAIEPWLRRTLLTHLLGENIYDRRS